jgi:hypothetical protein
MATLQDVIDEARVLLQDAAKVRYTDAELTDIANYAIFEAYRLRPDLNFANIGTDPVALAIGGTFPLPPQYQPVVANYITSRAELRDDEYSVEGRAVALLGFFKQSLLGAL